jgi:hypothetical protein
MLFQNRTFVTEAVVLEKYGLPPSALVDYFALIGDSADNIPGVTGALCSHICATGPPNCYCGTYMFCGCIARNRAKDGFCAD